MIITSAGLYEQYKQYKIRLKFKAEFELKVEK